MAVNFSLGMQKLDPETRKASRNPKGDKHGTRRASAERFEITAERRGAPLPWARPNLQRVRVTARERARVERRLRRDGWTTSTRRLRTPGSWW